MTENQYTALSLLSFLALLVTAIFYSKAFYVVLTLFVPVVLLGWYRFFRGR